MKNDSAENDKQMPKWEVALHVLFVIVLIAISAYLFFFAKDFNDVLRCIGGAASLFSVPAAFTIKLRHESTTAHVTVEEDKAMLSSSAQNKGNMCASKLASSDNNGTTIIGDHNCVYQGVPPQSATLGIKNAPDSPIPDTASLKSTSHDEHKHPTGQGQN